MILPRPPSAALWAGLISLDFTGCGPWMVSQPLVCGPLFGWLLGHLAVGLIVGGIVQLLWMDVTPVGVGIPYDTTSATLLAVYWASLEAHSSLSQIVLALLLAIPCGYAFRWMDQLARKVNTRLAHAVENAPDQALAPALSLGIFGGLAWSWLRYAGFYWLALWGGAAAWHKIHYFPKLTWFDQGLTMAVILLPVAGMGVALELFLSEAPEQRWANWRPFRMRRQRPENP